MSLVIIFGQKEVERTPDSNNCFNQMEEKRISSEYAGTVNDEEDDNVDENSKLGVESTQKTSLSFCEKLRDPVFKEKFVYSMFLASLFVTFGMYVGQHGPTFLDIQIITNTDIEAASAFFTSGNAGYLTGSVILGLLYNRINKALLLFILTFGIGVTNVFLPHCVQYELMIVVRFVSAVFGGGLNTGIHSEHMRLWGSGANGLLQFQHFCFSMGGFISPLIAEPFLAKKTDENDVSNNGTRSNSTNSSDIHQLRPPSDTRVEYLYLIVGILTVFSSIPFLIVFIADYGKRDTTEEIVKRRFSRKGVPFPLLILMLILICLFYFTYVCFEDSFLSFLMTFLVKEYDSVSKTKGALTTAVAWAAFAAGRFLMIFMTRILNTVQLLFLMTASMAIAFSSFAIFAHYGIVDALVVFSAISTLSCSGVFASGFSWMETEMFQVTGIISSCILVASSLGSIVNPLILGYLMEEVDNMWFCYLLVADTLVLCLLLSVLFMLSRYYVDKKYGTLISTLKMNSTMSPEDHDENGDIGFSSNDDGDIDNEDDDLCDDEIIDVKIKMNC